MRRTWRVLGVLSGLAVYTLCGAGSVIDRGERESLEHH